MSPSQFDQVTRLFAARRMTRRRVVAAGGGLAALGLAASAVSEGRAQDATPVLASPVAGDETGVHFLFVQTFGSGSLAPKAGDAKTLILTADHLAGQTLFFSDRPERVVGMVSTETFLGEGNPNEGAGFTPPDPPNAALVLEDGSTLVVELIDPTYDPVTGLVTYEVRVLDDIDQVDLQLQTEPVTVAEAPRNFTAASLFIDDCPDGYINCLNSNGLVGQIPSGFCYDAADLCCKPCASNSEQFWVSQCAATFPGSQQCAEDVCANLTLSEIWQCAFGQ